MEISTTAPPSLSLNPPNSPEVDLTETPTTQIHPAMPLNFTNGVLKRHPPPQLGLRLPSPPTPVTAVAAVTYKECMKNHAAARGGHALDGCGEFMPSPTVVASDPTSLKCAACGCHRNFHRRESWAAEVDDNHQPAPLVVSPTSATHVVEFQPPHRHHPPPPPTHYGRSPNSQSPPPISSSYYPISARHMLLSLGDSGGSNRGAGATMEQLHSPHNQTLFPPSRKRFRTKFSQDQKDKMYEFAEKVGWKMQKINEEMLAKFCSDVGVERGVFKVWMHNNKNTLGKKDLNANPSGSEVMADHDDHTNTTITTSNNENNGSSGNSDNNGNNGIDDNHEYAVGAIGSPASP